MWPLPGTLQVWVLRAARDILGEMPVTENGVGLEEPKTAAKTQCRSDPFKEEKEEGRVGKVLQCSTVLT